MLSASASPRRASSRRCLRDSDAAEFDVGRAVRVRRDDAGPRERAALADARIDAATSAQSEAPQLRQPADLRGQPSIRSRHPHPDPCAAWLSRWLFLAGFIWAVRSGQFEDTCTPSMRILTEDDNRRTDQLYTNSDSKTQSSTPIP